MYVDTAYLSTAMGWWSIGESECCASPLPPRAARPKGNAAVAGAMTSNDGGDILALLWRRCAQKRQIRVAAYAWRATRSAVSGGLIGSVGARPLLFHVFIHFLIDPRHEN